jgi:hypothetical protein
MFTFAHFMLAPEDPRSVAMVNGVHGSHLTEAYATLTTAHGMRVHAAFGAARSHKAHVRVLEGAGGDVVLLDTVLAKDDGPIEVGDVRVQVHAAAPVAVVVQNAHWKYTVTPGTYRTAADGAPHTRIDVAIDALTDPLLAQVAPHGLIGQGFDGLHIDGKTDSYQADKDGGFTTYAQGQGAIEGSIDDYLVQPQTDPFSTDFKFSRYTKRAAAPRSTSKLNPIGGGTGSMTSATGA